MNKERFFQQPEESPKYQDYDRVNWEARELAIQETNKKFGVLQGSATLDGYTTEQAVYFAQTFFGDSNISKAIIIPERNSSTGFNEFYIKAW